MKNCYCTFWSIFSFCILNTCTNVEAFFPGSQLGFKLTRDVSDGIAATSTSDKDLSQIVDNLTDEEILTKELERCEGEIIDPHIHTAPWFNNDPDALVEELTASNISTALLYDPYPKLVLPYDVNTYVHQITSGSKGRVYMLASFNTTHDNWEEHREAEMERLRTFLDKDDVVLGAKLAPPHCALPLQSPMINDFFQVVAESKQKLVAIHIGTTPFCGPLGKAFGLDIRCGAEYVNPALLRPNIEQYPDVKFILLHSGHEFLPPDTECGCYYDFKYRDECIKMAAEYPNVWLSMSALFAQEPDGTLKYPGGEETLKKMKEAGVTHKVFWGSDASFKQGQIKPVLLTAIRSMMKAGWTDEERTWALRGLTKELFCIPE